jgi:hypothetical protein
MAFGESLHADAWLPFLVCTTIGMIIFAGGVVTHDTPPKVTTT